MSVMYDSVLESSNSGSQLASEHLIQSQSKNRAHLEKYKIPHDLKIRMIEQSYLTHREQV
jgi:hypothetical protein